MSLEDWYDDRNCRHIDRHKWSYFQHVIQCIDQLAEEIHLYDNSDDLNLKDLKKHLMVVVVDLYHRWFHVEFNGGIAYSRDNNNYKLQSRYNKMRINRKPLIHIIEQLIEFEFVDHMKGFKNYDYGVNSKIRATPKLINYIKSFNVDPNMIWLSKGMKELIIIKDKRKRKIEYIDNDYSNRSREELVMYIERLSKHKISCKGKDFIRLDSLNINRIYQDSFKYGGRIYGGFWQYYVTSKERNDILIDNEETIELDFSNQTIRILYALEGKDHDIDVYDIPGYNRKLVKKAFLCILNCKNKDDAIKAIQGVINKDKYLHNWWISNNKPSIKPNNKPSIKLNNKPNNKLSIKLLLDTIEFNNQEINFHFYKEVGMLCQRIDSDICIRIINQFVDIGKPVLTIHDSFIVKERDKQLLFDIMLNKYQEVLNINIIDPNTLIH